MNPFATKMYPWHIAIARRQSVLWTTLPLIWSEAYFKTWAAVYRG